MVAFDARYSAQVFPYRPHHYGYLQRSARGAAALLRGQRGAGRRAGSDRQYPDQQLRDLRVQPPRPRRAYSLLLGNLSRFAPVQVQVFGYYGDGARTTEEISLTPKAHVEVSSRGKRGPASLSRRDQDALPARLLRRRPPRSVRRAGAVQSPVHVLQVIDPPLARGARRPAALLLYRSHRGRAARGLSGGALATPGKGAHRQALHRLSGGSPRLPARATGQPMNRYDDVPVPDLLTNLALRHFRHRPFGDLWRVFRRGLPIHAL